MTLRAPMLRTQTMALAWAIDLACVGIAQAQGMATPVAATGEIRRQLETLLPALRIDDGDLQRALDPPAWTACRRLTLEWRGPNPRTADATSDGTVSFITAGRCREPYDVRASARIAPGGLVAVATDAEGALRWWRQFPDIRRVTPALFPATGDERADRENRRLHAEGVRAGYALFDLELPGDRKIARLWVFEVPGDASVRSPVQLGRVDVPAP